ncbi:MAG: YjgP/YjgQ family permease [Treponema sp.]|nr:YjgP/YjgQ family permease [Treponema sp.]
MNLKKIKLPQFKISDKLKLKISQIHFPGQGKHILLKYIIKELVLYFTMSFLFFFLVFFFNQILLMAEEVLKKRVPIIQVLKLISFSLPFIIAQSAPFATLVGFLMCIGRLMSDNEILIIRASGLSFRIILIPVLILGLLISIVSFIVNDYLLPLGTISYNNLYREIIMSNPSVELESNSIKRTKDLTFIIGNVTDKIVSDLLFFDTDSEGNQRIIFSGETKIISPEDKSILMQLKMKNPFLILMDNKNKTSIDYIQSEDALMNVFSSSVFSKSTAGVNPREMTSYDLKQKIDNMKKQPQKFSPSQLNIFKQEFHKKFSLPFGSLFFSFLAMPLAIIFGKINGQTIGLIIGILLSVIYWAMMILGQTFGIRNGLNGFWTMWLPNILVGVAALLFYLRLRKK